MKSWLESLNDDTPKQFNVVGDKPEPIINRYNTRVKGSELLYGKFFISPNSWVEIDVSLFDGKEIDPEKYYNVEAESIIE
jgi:hypothetical protein